MARTFLFTFDELPLVIDLGFEAGLVAGEAEIAYTDDVYDFSVNGIWLDGHKAVKHSEEQKLLARLTGKSLPSFHRKLVPADGWIERAIRQRLENEKSADVLDAIREEIAAERQYRRDEAADDRRNDRVSA